MRTAAALIIGNELLSGKIEEKNLFVLARELRALGVLLRRTVMILDEVAEIAREVRELSAAHDVVFTSGGVGPTHDDLTIEGVARAFEVGVVVAPEIESMIRRYYGERLTEGNLVVLARELRSLGVLLRRAVMILDEVEESAREVRELSAAHDVVFTSGGVGPTPDDLTIEGVARAFGVGVVVAPEIEGMIRRYYAERVTEGHLLMARIPEGARLVSSAAIPWPTVVMRNVWVLPGVPEVFQMKLPHVRAELDGGTPFSSLAVYTRLDEGDLKPLLDRVVAAHTGVDVGSYPQWHDAEYRTKLTFDGLDEARVRAARDAFLAELPAGALVRTE